MVRRLACHGLGMKASIGWIMVFAGTVLTHGKHAMVVAARS